MRHVEADAPEPPRESIGGSGLSFGGLTEFDGRVAGAGTPDFGPGTRLGDVTIVRLLDEGGMGRVYEGVQGMPSRTVAVKLIRPGVLSAKAAKRFEYEAQIMGRLTHPGIARIYSVGIQQLSGCDTPYFVMEYIEGALSLTAFATQRELSTRHRVELFSAACAAVAHGHQKGVIHRDLKPANMLVGVEGDVVQPRVIDFGVARSTDGDVALTTMHTNVGQIVGTIAYMSPEQFDGDADDVDIRADVYALGIVLYELLTGRRLFKSKTREETLARVRRAEVPSPRAWRPSVSDELENFLLKTLARDPADRWQDGAEMLEALAGITLRERHRAGNNELAKWMREVIDVSNQASDLPKPAKERIHAPARVVVLSVEASPLPRSVGAPMSSLDALQQEWDVIVAEGGGDAWESGIGNLLLVWVGAEVEDMVARAVRTATRLQRVTAPAGFQLSAGISPGMARIATDTRRPPDGWELAGPFYLARWMMNLSAHRGRVVLTEVAARSVREATTLVGRIPIQGSRFISLYELG